MTLNDLIVEHVASSGPVTLASIRTYMVQQAIVPITALATKVMVQDLVDKGIIEVYDPGENTVVAYVLGTGHKPH